jgi:hypothetical protein
VSDEAKICLALLEAARSGVVRARRRARWNMFWSLVAGSGELGFFSRAVVLGLTLTAGYFWSTLMGAPVWVGPLIVAVALVVACAIYAHRAYDRLPPDHDMKQMVDAELRGLNDLLAGRDHFRVLEMNNVDALDHELAAIEAELTNEHKSTYR